MSFLSDQRARNLARKDSRLWAAGAGGRTGLAAPIGSGIRQGGGGRPSLDGQTVVAADPVYLAAGDAQAAADAAQAVADDAALTGAAAQVAADEAASAAAGAQDVADAATLAANNVGPTQITDDAIETRHLTAGAVVAGKIAAGTITAGSAIIATAAISSAQIAGLTASSLTAGTIDANVITVANINGANIRAGTLSANLISGGTISGVTFRTGSPFGRNITLTDSAMRFYDDNGDQFGRLESFGTGNRSIILDALVGGTPWGNVEIGGSQIIMQPLNGFSVVGAAVVSGMIYAGGGIDVNGSNVRTFANTSIPSGTRTSYGTAWSNGDGRTGNPVEYSTYPGAHKHQVADHTHTISI